MSRLFPWSAVSVVIAVALLDPGLAAAQTGPASLTLAEAFEIGLRENPEVRQAGYQRGVAGAGLWDAYGNLLPRLSLDGQVEHAGEGGFILGGTPFASPEVYSTVYRWTFRHTLLDAGRDLFRIRAARSTAEGSAAEFDARWWETRAEIGRQYVEARRQAALVAQAGREIERRLAHERLARRRYELGAVTRSDLLQAELSVNQGRVAELEARQRAQESRLALRRLLGGALPPDPIELTTEFEVFEPAFDGDVLLDRALATHPRLLAVEAQASADDANLWIARSSYLPALEFRYDLSRSIADTSSFEFSDFVDRDSYALLLNWSIFDGFQRHHEVSRANAALQSSRAEAQRIRLEIEEDVMTALSRLETAHAAWSANRVSLDLAEEDLRLGEARYETGAGSFVDLLDARVRATEAETDVIGATYDFVLALIELERATGLVLMPYAGER